MVIQNLFRRWKHWNYMLSEASNWIERFITLGWNNLHDDLTVINGIESTNSISFILLFTYSTKWYQCGLYTKTCCETQLFSWGQRMVNWIPFWISVVKFNQWVSSLVKSLVLCNTFLCILLCMLVAYLKYTSTNWRFGKQDFN